HGQDAAEAKKKRCLARAVGADQSDALSRRDVEIELFQRQAAVGIPERQAADVDHEEERVRGGGHASDYSTPRHVCFAGWANDARCTVCSAPNYRGCYSTA